ncbi:MAG: citrate/2-methylcitrate synthase, partial [Planctomycetaceae bacterium]|nr:citrate/2-methylcitrate synthase [Planctomycetaceae bacterium]
MSQEIYSPGLEGVIAGETAISTITGGLQYRGYSIEDLGNHATFEEVAYLILYGDLPTREQLAAFDGRLKASAPVAPEIIKALAAIPTAASMMD